MKTVNQHIELWAAWCDIDGLYPGARLHYITSYISPKCWRKAICGSEGMGYTVRPRKKRCANCERVLAAARAGRPSHSAIARWLAQPTQLTDDQSLKEEKR